MCKVRVFTKQATVALPSSVVKRLWEVFVCGFGVLFLSCACVSVSGVLLSVGVCVCELLIFLHKTGYRWIDTWCAYQRSWHAAASSFGPQE